MPYVYAHFQSPLNVKLLPFQVFLKISSTTIFDCVCGLDAKTNKMIDSETKEMKW
jgi:hypothetical protein